MSITITQTVQRVKLKRKNRVTWTEDTVDNEHLNKKSSKVCCIYHQKKHSECEHKNKYERM